MKRVMRHALLPRSLARFNKVVTNRVQGLWAPYLPPYAVIVHRGRTSGTEYRTPVTAFRGGGALVVPLLYGDGSDWVRNVLAAGGGEVRRGGRVRRIVRPRVLESGRSVPEEDLPAVARGDAQIHEGAHRGYRGEPWSGLIRDNPFDRRPPYGMLSAMRVRGIVATATLLPMALLPALTGCGPADSFFKHRGGPPPPTPSAPSGWQGVTGGRFGYIVRQDWKLKLVGDVAASSVYEDAAGRWHMKVDEYTGCGDPDRPEKLSSFAKGVDPYDNLQTYSNQSRPRKMKVPGTAGAWRYELAGSKGGHYTVFNVWSGDKRRPCSSELWMTVLNDRATATLIAAHFTAAPPR
jgi:deazaflavin-dependent oxidoreductase (nitroreductase family)